MDWNEALNICIQATERGSEVLLRYFGQLSKVQEKGLEGLVSEADVESERVITDFLKEKYPDIPMLGEESAFQKNWIVPETTWILDPLDGTTNYVHGFAVFCISLALRYKGELKVGVVRVPLLNQLFTAVQGQGACLNSQPIHASRRREIGDALLATGFLTQDLQELEEQIRIFSHLVKQARGVRRAGAAAYDLCLVANGTFDAFWERGLKPWDMAAGSLLVREAGGVVLNYEGGDHEIGDRGLLASNKELAPFLVQKIQTSLKS